MVSHVAHEPWKPPTSTGRPCRSSGTTSRTLPPYASSWTTGTAPGEPTVSSVVPGSAGVPIRAYSRAPRRVSRPMLAQVSALLSSVGRPRGRRRLPVPRS